MIVTVKVPICNVIRIGLTSFRRDVTSRLSAAQRSHLQKGVGLFYHSEDPLSNASGSTASSGGSAGTLLQAKSPPASPA